MGKADIYAVHKKKLEEFLKKLDLWEPLKEGKLKCMVCEATITLDNIGLIIPTGGEIVLCCSKADCMFRAREFQGEGVIED